MSALVVIQIAFGAATLLSLGPIVMQLGHLFLADMVWIAVIFMAANYFAAEPEMPKAEDLVSGHPIES
ncbi:MAG: hypothetical protein IPP63_00335 [Chloracidobacterium sp.]|nr:hypothetical protein [Chloracidobacterium sp.]